MAYAAVWRRVCLAVVTFTLILFGGPCLAQEAPPADEETLQEQPEERPVVVSEIVVTAQKREQNVQDVPMAVSTMSGEDLSVVTVGGPDVQVLSARIPSLVLESSFGRIFPRFYMRGLGNSDFDLNASQPVSMVIDEVVLENPMLKGMPIWDLDRIEVLRGPQGTLFGRNTPAGVVKFETMKPSQETDAEFRLSYGSFDSIDFNGGIGGPITDTFSYRFSGLYQSRSDWVDNDFTGEEDALGGHETAAYRLQFLWEPSESFSGLINVHGWELDGTARLFRANIIQPGTNDLVDDFEQDTVYYDGLNEQEADAQGATLRLEYDFDGAQLVSITGWETIDMFSRGDIDGGYGAVYAPPSGPGLIPYPSESADGIPDLDQLTQEVRLATTGDRALNWLMGVFYFNEDLQVDSFSYDTLAGNVQDGYAFQVQETDSYALFGSLDWAASDRWNLGAGLRFSNDEKDFSAERPDPTFNSPTVAPITRQTDDDFIGWDVNAAYELSTDVSVYSRLATSHRAPSIQGRIMFCADFEGGVNPATNCVSVADTEEILSFETGIKSIILDRRLRLNLTGYVYEVDGQQVTAVGGEYNTATLLNIDTTNGYGFESDIEFTPSGHVLTTFGLSYNSTEIDDPNLAVAPCAGGCTVLDPIGPNGAMVDGNSLPHAPEWIFNGIVGYRSSPGQKGFFGVLDWAYYSEKQFFIYESEEFRGDGLEIGLRLGYAWSQTKYEVALWSRNITDEEIVQGGIDFNNLTGMTNDPRTIGVEFIGRF